MATFFGNHRKSSSDDPLRCAIFISGSGTGMKALLNHQNNNSNCLHKTSLVVCNEPEAKGIKLAESFGIPVLVSQLPEINDKKERRLEHERIIDQSLQINDIELIVLSGYMRLLSAEFISRWNLKIINIHPSLLPEFPGAYAHRDVLSAGVNISGCSVHYVDEGMDTGEVIAQRKVPVFPDDTVDSLSQRVKFEEHILYPSVIDKLCL